MARAPDPRIEQAKAMYLNGMKLVEIASQLNLPEGTVRRWKCTHKWDSERSEKKSERSRRKRGGQPGNHNASGPPGNDHAVKHGLFRKWLPEDAVSIIEEMPENPLDVLWDQIRIAYAAIIRAQQIMYVKDKNDMTKERTMSGDTMDAWDVQYAWDKQGNFLKAQARAQSALQSMIKQYDELLHKNWDLATDEQRARIAQIKAQTEKINRESIPEDDDGVVIINDAPKGD